MELGPISDSMRPSLTPASEQDRPWLDELRRSVYQELFQATWGGWDEARHRRHCDACWDLGHVYTVEAGGRRVGMLQLLDHEEELEVGEIQVHPTHQGQGIGSQVLKATLERARAQGKRVVLSVGLQNARAVQLYERLGFRHVSRSTTHFHMEAGSDD